MEYNNNEIHLFADGSYVRSLCTAFAGVVVVRGGKIIAEHHQSSPNTANGSHEPFAILEGLRLVAQIEDAKRIHVYSDDINKVKLYSYFMDANVEKYDKVFLSKLSYLDRTVIKELKNFWKQGVYPEFHWAKDEWTYGLLRAHQLSRKWHPIDGIELAPAEDIKILLHTDIQFIKESWQKKQERKIDAFRSIAKPVIDSTKPPITIQVDHNALEAYMNRGSKTTTFSSMGREAVTAAKVATDVGPQSSSNLQKRNASHL